MFTLLNVSLFNRVNSHQRQLVDCAGDAEFLLTPFIPPSLNELERGDNWIKQFSHRPSLFQKRGDGGELREGCGGRRWAKRTAGTASPSVESVIAMGEARSNQRHCEPLFRKGEAISYWMCGDSFEIASFTVFIRNDRCLKAFAMTTRRGLPKR